MKVHYGSKVEPKVQRCELQSSHVKGGTHDTRYFESFEDHG